MNDREMLEFAAKAAGIELVWHGDADPWCFAETVAGIKWNPLTDDGDAFRLMVTLRLCQLWQHDYLMVYSGDVSVRERNLDGHRAATRRAITRAAAEIGRAMG